MDLEANPELIYGEEFCFPATATYYPTPYAPAGFNLPADLYEQYTGLGRGNQDLHYPGLQAEGASCMYYVVPDYGIAHSPLVPYPLEPGVIAGGRFVEAQEYLANNDDITYRQPIPTPPYDVSPSAVYRASASTSRTLTYTDQRTYCQPVPTSPHDVFPSAANRTSASTSQTLAYTDGRTYRQPGPKSPYDVFPSEVNRTPVSMSQTLAYSDGLFIPGRGRCQTVPVASKRGIACNPSLQSTSVYAEKFQDHVMLPKVQVHSSDPWKQELAGGGETKAPQHSLHGMVPSVKRPPPTNQSSSSTGAYVGSDLRKMVAARKFQPSSKPSRCASSYSQRFSSLSQQNLGKAKNSLGTMPSEIFAKSYTSSVHVGYPEGKIIIKTDQYNRDDFRVVYGNAKFFVIKSYDEANIHKSIKYGVWSSSEIGNQKLDNAFKDAQATSLCPVFLFFSVNGSSSFCGVAEMVGPVDFQKQMDFWCEGSRWIGSFPVRWRIIKDVPNYLLQWILLQNNEDKPVTKSRDTQEIRYAPGTSMLKIFKDFEAKECLLDDFTMYEEEEATRGQFVRSKLRRDAPHFVCVPKNRRYAYGGRQPEADSALMDRIIRETRDLAEKLQHTDLDSHQGSLKESGNLIKHQGSWKESRNLIRDSAKAYAKRESNCDGKQTHANIVEAVPYQPLTSNMPASLAGEEQTWEKVEAAPIGNKHSETAADGASKEPEEYRNEAENALVPSVSRTPEMICEEQNVIGKHCSLAINSQISEACSSDLFMPIGSMLVPIKMSN